MSAVTMVVVMRRSAVVVGTSTPVAPLWEDPSLSVMMVAVIVVAVVMRLGVLMVVVNGPTNKLNADAVVGIGWVTVVAV